MGFFFNRPSQVRRVKTAMAPLFATETRLARKLRKFRTSKIAVSDSSSAVSRTRFVTDIPPDRIEYLKRYWLFIKRYLAEKYRILGRIDFEGSELGLDTMDKTMHADGLERVEQLLSLLVSNVPFQFCVFSLHASITVEFVRAGHMFKNDETFYLRKHRLLTPDVRTLTYLELFTNCNVIFDKKTIILFGTKKGVEKVRVIIRSNGTTE